MPMKNKFTPNIDPKHQKLHDTERKIHISFGEDNDKAISSAKSKSESKSTSTSKTKTKEKGTKEKTVKEKAIPTQTVSKNSSNGSNSDKKEEAAPSAPPTVASATKRKPGMNADLPDWVRAQREKKKLKRKSRQVIDGVKVAVPSLKMNPSHLKHYLQIHDIGKFVIYCLGEAPNPSFGTIINKSTINHVVLAFCEGLDITHFGAPEDRTEVPKAIDLSQLDPKKTIGKVTMPFLTSQFTHMIVNKATGSKGVYRDPVSEVMQYKLSLTKQEQRTNEIAKRIEDCKGEPRPFYTLTLDEMRRANYPIPPCLDPSVTLQEDWKETRPVEEPTPKKRLVAVDCEMVETAEGDTLARVTLVAEDGKTLLDEYVKPKLPVLDYRTQFSGITPDIVAAASCSLRRVQKYVRRFVDHNVILVGHSLDSDLRALKMVHPYCMDTALMYDHVFGPPYRPSLRHLVRHLLRTEIQQGSHNSEEDALMTLRLVQRKMKQSLSFPWSYFKTELIFDRLAMLPVPRSGAILECSQGNNMNYGFTQGRAYARCETDEQLVDQVIQHTKDQQFVFARFRSLVQETSSVVPAVMPSFVSGDGKIATRLVALDGQLRRLYDGLPSGTVFIVMGSVVMTEQYTRLLGKYQMIKEKRAQGIDVSKLEGEDRWTDREQFQLYEEAAKSRLGCTFITVKAV